LSILKVNSCSIDQDSGEICTAQTDLQQIYSKSDSLLKEAVGLFLFAGNTDPIAPFLLGPVQCPVGGSN